MADRVPKALNTTELSREFDAQTLSDDEAVRGRVGFRLFKLTGDWLGMTDAAPYLNVGFQHDYTDDGTITVDTTGIREEVPEPTADLGVGFTGSALPGVQLHFDLRYQEATSAGDGRGVG